MKIEYALNGAHHLFIRYQHEDEVLRDPDKKKGREH
jgi:hypothetical protein